jgi:hypothetical protein
MKAKNGVRPPSTMWRGADAVARDVCEAIVVDGSSLAKAKQVVCQPLLSAIRQQLAHGVKGLIPFDGYSASKVEDDD